MGLFKRRPAAETGTTKTASAGELGRPQVMGVVIRGTPRWQQEVDVYDQHGPGFVGAMLDLVASKTTEAGVKFVYRDMKDDWVDCEGTLLQVCRGVWRRFQGRYDEPEQLVGKLARLRMKIGDSLVVTLADGTKVIGHPNSRTGASTLRVEGRWVTYQDPLTNVMEKIPYPSPRVLRLWRPLDSDERLATSEHERAIVHVREYITAKLRQQADANSRTTINGGISFGEGTDIYKNPDNDDDPRNGMPQAMLDYIELVNREDRWRYHDVRPTSAKVPLPMIGPKPELFDIGRAIDEAAFELEEKSLRAYARSIRVPNVYVIEGPGLAKYDNEDAVKNALAEDAIEPVAREVLRDITRAWFRPILKQVLGQFPNVKIRADDILLIPNIDRIRPKTDRTASITAGYTAGIVGLTDAADALGVQPRALPSDVSEYDHWKTASGKAAKPEGEAAAGGAPAVTAPPVVPKKTPPTAIAAAGDPITEQEAVVEEAQEVVDRLQEIDRRIYAGLLATAASEYLRERDEFERKLVRSLPPGPLRDAAHAAEPGRMLQAVMAAGGVPQVDELLADSFARYEKMAEDDMRAELLLAAAIIAAAYGAGRRPNYRAAEGAKVSANGLRRMLRDRVLGGSSSAGVPDGIVRAGMQVAGGAVAESDPGGFVVRTNDGAPRSVGNTPWVGGDGAAAGHEGMQSVLAGAADDGAGLVRVMYRWVHGMYRAPLVPYEPHVMLNDTLQATAGATAGGYYPGDHPHCSCGFIITITLGNGVMIERTA